ARARGGRRTRRAGRAGPSAGRGALPAGRASSRRACASAASVGRDPGRPGCTGPRPAAGVGPGRARRGHPGGDLPRPSACVTISVPIYRADISTGASGAPETARPDRIRPHPTERGVPVLELAVLGLLKEQPLHGYELKKRLGETLGFLWGVSYGSLYPALRRLERDGAIEIVLEPAPAPARVPPTGSLTGDLAAARRAGA